MNNYKAKQNCDTFKSYVNGVLGSKAEIIKAGTIIKATEVAPGVLEFTMIVNNLSATRWTKKMWFDLVPSDLPPPTPLPEVEYILHVKDGVTRKFVLLVPPA